MSCKTINYLSISITGRLFLFFQEIGLCDRTKKPAINDFPVEKMIVKEKVQLLGTNECTYGPAYWCASRENAKKCKVILLMLFR